MSVDYGASYGIGFAVDVPEAFEEVDDFHFEEFLDDQLADGFQYFKVGNDMTGELDSYYLVLKEPFKYGLDLTKVKEELEIEAERLGLEILSDFDVVGGLLIW